MHAVFILAIERVQFGRVHGSVCSPMKNAYAAAGRVGALSEQLTD